MYNYNVIQIKTRKRIEFFDITQDIERIVSNSNIGEGIAVIFTKHTTTGLAINENERGLISDMEKILKMLIPEGDYEHNRIDNNADSHLRSLILGQHVTLPVNNGKLELGTWQRVFLVELDGPRSRNIVVKVIEG